MSKLSVLERVDLQIPVMVSFTYIFLPFFVSKNVKLFVNNKFANNKCEVKQNKQKEMFYFQIKLKLAIN